jgi:hypothetical protein
MSHELFNISSCLFEISLLLFNQYNQLLCLTIFLALVLRWNISEALVNFTSMSHDQMFELLGVKFGWLIWVHGFKDEKLLVCENE